MNKKYNISIENLHLISGFSLVISGLLVYSLSGIEMMLSWCVFGAMYISMSDIGEDNMSVEVRNSWRHKNRRLFGYVGSALSVFLVVYYLNNIFQII